MTFPAACPLPVQDYPNVLMAHGGGGRLMDQLIESVFVDTFDNEELSRRHDGVVLPMGDARVAFTTDSYVVRPLFFPGSDIGEMAVNGTVNDLAMCGARPRYLSCGFILEEGLPTETLWQVVSSMKRAADRAGVKLVTGDTKVVDKGKGDGLYINTAGVGIVEHDVDIAPQNVHPGDVMLLSGDIGRHGMAIMAVREGLEFESPIQSDCAPVHGPVLEMLDAGLRVRCLRDLTRGGLASALVEIATTAGRDLVMDEAAIPVQEPVRGACELLGFDPLYVANEGRFVAFVDPADADAALAIMQRHDPEAARIGVVEEGTDGRVGLTSRIGARRVVDKLSGEQLPRIC